MNKRKVEREQKKKEKEEAAKKKADECARKAEDAAENRAKKRIMPASGTGIQAKNRKTTSDSTLAGTSTTTNPSTSSSSTDPGTSTSSSSRYPSCLSAAAAHSGTSENDFDATINSDVCWVCYLTFEDNQQEGNGLEWVQCVCGGGYTRSAYVKLIQMIKAANFFFVHFVLFDVINVTYIHFKNSYFNNKVLFPKYFYTGNAMRCWVSATSSCQ